MNEHERKIYCKKQMFRYRVSYITYAEADISSLK